MEKNQIESTSPNLPLPDLSKVREVIIAGNYGGGNLGDEAMLDVLAHLLSVRLSDLKIIVPSRRPDVISALHKNVNIIPVGLVKGALRALLSDMLIIGGGTIFSALAGAGIRAIVAIAIARKLLLGKKFYFYGIGYSSSTSRMLSLLARIAFNLADAIYVRDSLSYSYIKRQINHDRLILIPEIARWLKESDLLPSETMRIFEKQGQPVIGFSLMYVASSDQNQRIPESIQKFIAYLYARYRSRFVFLTFQPRVINYSEEWQSDYEIAARIVGSLPAEIRNNCHVLEYYPPNETLRIVKELDVVISMRYHCLVFAHMQQKPYLAIGFDDKHSSFVSDFGGEYLDLEQLSGQDMIDKWEKMHVK